MRVEHGRSACYSVLFVDAEDRVTAIRDLGPWDEHPTVTNDAEDVVERLEAAGMLPSGHRLFYIDSEGDWTELLLRQPWELDRQQKLRGYSIVAGFRPVGIGSVLGPLGRALKRAGFDSLGRPGGGSA